MKNRDVYTTINKAYVDVICSHLGGRLEKTVNGNDTLYFNGAFQVHSTDGDLVTLHSYEPLGVSSLASYCQKLSIPYDSYNPEIPQTNVEYCEKGRILDNGIFAIGCFYPIQGNEEKAKTHTDWIVDGKLIEQKELENTVVNDIAKWEFQPKLEDIVVTEEDIARLASVQN